MFISASIAKMPNYIIGETRPVRSLAPIDSISYWDSDSPQLSMIKFLSLGLRERDIYLFMQIINYQIYQLAENRDDRLLAEDDIEYMKINENDLIILRDKYKDMNYTNRVHLPTQEFLNKFAKVYTNSDYICYVG